MMLVSRQAALPRLMAMSLAIAAVWAGPGPALAVESQIPLAPSPPIQGEPAPDLPAAPGAPSPKLPFVEKSKPAPAKPGDAPDDEAPDAADAAGPPPADTGRQLVDARDPEKVLEAVRGFGSATLEVDNEGDPKIRGRMKGTVFSVYFYGCNNANKGCRSINFYASWEKGDVTLDQLNKWNSDKRFIRAYLDDDQEPVLEMDANLFGGVTRDNLEDTIDWWAVSLDRFKEGVIDKQ